MLVLEVFSTNDAAAGSHSLTVFHDSCTTLEKPFNSPLPTPASQATVPNRSRLVKYQILLFYIPSHLSTSRVQIYSIIYIYFFIQTLSISYIVFSTIGVLRPGISRPIATRLPCPG